MQYVRSGVHFLCECAHETVEERPLRGTWVLDEIRLSIQKGYNVIDIFKGYEYSVTQYNPRTREDGQFVEYINRFLSLKAEGSGYPSYVRSPEDQERYIENFYAREDGRLYRDSIRPNAAKREWKPCLNSLSGKFTEPGNRTQTKLISDPNELYRFLAMPGVEVQNLLFPSDCCASLLALGGRGTGSELTSYQRGCRRIRCLRRSHASVGVRRQTKRANSDLQHG